MKPNYVYVIRYGNRDHKIGISDDPDRRIRELLPGPKFLIRTWYRPTGDARRVELSSHRILDQFALGGERFSVGAKAASAAVELAIALREDCLATEPDVIGLENLKAWLAADKLPAQENAIGWIADPGDAESTIEMRRRGVGRNNLYWGTDLSVAIKGVHDGDVFLTSKPLPEESRKAVEGYGGKVRTL